MLLLDMAPAGLVALGENILQKLFEGWVRTIHCPHWVSHSACLLVH